VLPCAALDGTCDASGGSECVPSLMQKEPVKRHAGDEVSLAELASDSEAASGEAAQTSLMATWTKLGAGECDGPDPDIIKIKRISRNECQQACDDDEECNFYGFSYIKCILYRHCNKLLKSNYDIVTYIHPDEGSCRAPDDINAQPGGICCQGSRIPTGGRCTPFCAEGFSPSVNEVRCSRGKLMPAGLKCVRDPCLAPVRVAYAHEDGICKEGPAIEHRGSCTVQCATGFKPTVDTLECQKGTLSPQTVECRPKYGVLLSSAVETTPPNRMKGLLPPAGGWRGSTQLERFRVNGFPCHLYRYYWSSGNTLKPYEVDFITSGGIIWLSVQPRDWKEAASRAYRPVLDELCKLVKKLAPAQVMISAGHEPDRHCTICDNHPEEIWGTIQDYNEMGKAFRKRFAENNVKNVIWIMNFAGTQDPQLFQQIVVPMWPGDGVIGWLFFNTFQLGGHMDKGGGPLVGGVERMYNNFETFSTPGTNFKSVPWGLGAWAISHQNEHCDMASYIYSAKTTIESGRYPRIKAAVYFDSKTFMMLDELRPVYKHYLAIDYFTVNDKHLPAMLGCDAPSKNACKEGGKVPSGGVCTAQCSEGKPSLASLTCFNGVLTPPSFTCAGAWEKVGMGSCTRTAFISQDNTMDETACQASCMNEADCGAFCFSPSVKPYCVRTVSCPSLIPTTKSGKDRTTHTCYVAP